jgi:hypothetical protein
VQLPRLDAGEVEVRLASEVRVHSGFVETAELSVRNLGVRELSFRTNGNLITRVVDPASSEVVGGCWGAQTAPFVVFRATRRRCDS